MADGGSKARVSRRRFLKSVAVASGALAGKTLLLSDGKLASAATAPVVKKELKFLAFSGYTKQTDQEMARQADEWAQQNNVTIKWERVVSQSLNDRIAAAVMTQAGPDLCAYMGNLAHLYRESFADVGEVAVEASKVAGGWFKDREMGCRVDGVWRAVAFQYSVPVLHYRDDWFKQAGVEAPKTFDEYIEAAQTMKRWGKPFGEATSHEPSDAGSFWYPWLWAYGGKEVLEDGKTIAINSPETLEAVEKGVTAYDQFIPGTLSWDGASNNRAFYAGAVSATHNSPSALLTAKKMPSVGPGTKLASTLAGPKVRPVYLQGQQYSIFSYSKNIDLAKDLIRHLTKFENLSKFIDIQDGYGQGCGPKMLEGHPIFVREPRLLPVKESLENSVGGYPGWPGPPGKAATEALYRFIIIDMFAKAASREMTPKEAIAWAEGQLKAIYSRA